MPVLTPVATENPGLTMPVQSYQLMLADPWTLADYTDITPFVKQWNGTVRGRQHELQLFQTGQVALTLEGNLSGGRFNPWNTAGPYYNLLTPGDASCETTDGTFRTTPVTDNWTNGSTTVNCSVFQSIPSVIIDGPVAHTVAIGANFSTSISSGDNTNTLATIVTAGKLLVATTTGASASGFIAVQCNTGGTPSIAIAILQYTSVTGGATPSFNGISIVQGTSTWTVSTGGSVLQSTTASTVTTADNVYSVTGGQYYTTMCSFLADSSVFPYGANATCGLNILWYTSGGSLISTTTGPTITDNQASWTKVSNLGVQAPSTAAYAALQVTITGIAEERHYFSRVALFNYVSNVPNTAWAPGHRGLVPARQMKAFATWAGVTNPVWSMYVSNWTPQYGQVKSEQVLNLSDGLALLALDDISSSAYANQVLTDGANNFWRLGDTILSTLATDMGPFNNPMAASNVSFGQVSPLLTDDTTVALMYSTTTGQGYVTAQVNGPAAGAQTLEMLFMLPTQTTNAVFMLGYNSGASVYFNPTTNVIQVVGVSSGINFSTSAVPAADNGQWHHLVITCSAATNGTVTVYLDGVQIGTATATGGNSSCLFNATNGYAFGGSGWGSTYDGSLADIAIYPTALTAAQVANHYALFSAGWAVQYSGQRIQNILNVIGWPSSLQNIATGIQQCQGATSSLTTTAALSYLQTVASTEMGSLFCDPSGIVTFYDRHYIITAPAATISNCTLADDTNPAHYHYMPGLVPAMDDVDLWNDIPCQRTGGILQRTTNTLSIKQYTKRTLTGYTGELQTNDNDVLAQSQWLAAHYSVPYTRCRSVTLSSRTDNGKNLVQMLGRGILDNITLIWKPIDGSTVSFNQASLIESIAHVVTQAEWVTTWGLSPAETQPYMILNNPTLGQLSTVNQLGY
jgi:hypothetical protein